MLLAARFVCLDGIMYALLAGLWSKVIVAIALTCA
jgi:hypothetical protein